MISSGLLLMLVGLGGVFIFLAILVYTIKRARRFVAKQTANGIEEPRAVSGISEEERQRGIAREADEPIVAVISAAIAAYCASVGGKKLVSR